MSTFQVPSSEPPPEPADDAAVDGDGAEGEEGADDEGAADATASAEAGGPDVASETAAGAEPLNM